MNTATIIDVCRRQSNDGFQLHEHYVEPDYTDPKDGLIAIGNWNSQQSRKRVFTQPLPDGITVSDPDAMYEYEDKTMPRIGNILEKMGFELEWCDEWATCDACNGLVRTSPDSWGWLPSYWQNECTIVCRGCVRDDPDDYIDYLDGNPRAANTLLPDLTIMGYRKVDAEYESGLHIGQDDDPKTISAELKRRGISRYIFEIDSTGQFDINFSVWVHKSEWDKIGENKIESVGFSPSKAMMQLLKRH